MAFMPPPRVKKEEGKDEAIEPASPVMRRVQRKREALESVLRQRGEEFLEQSISNSNCCYGIEWMLCNDGYLECKAHYNPPWRVTGVQQQGLKGLYTSESASCRFKQDECLIGKVYTKQTLLFVEDLQAIVEDLKVLDMIGDAFEFARADIAKKYGIRSALFVPSSSGVIEIGSTQKVESRADLVRDDTLSAILAHHEGTKQANDYAVLREPTIQKKTQVVSPLDAILPAIAGSLRLQRLVEGSPACYAIEWKAHDDGYIRYDSHYNPPWRVEGVRRQGLKGLYTTESARQTFVPGEGLVGKAFESQTAKFVADLQICDRSEYLRVDLAKEYDIHSALFLPMPTGVIELGTTDLFQCAVDFVPKKVLAACHVLSKPEALEISHFESAHYQGRHLKAKYQCPECRQRFNAQGILDQHWKFRHVPKGHQQNSI